MFLALLVMFVSTNLTSATTNEYWINDSSYSLKTYLANKGNANTIYVNANLTSVDDVEIDSSYQSITGWKKSFFENQESLRQVGNVNAGSVTFKDGSNVTINFLNFYKKVNDKNAVGTKVIIEKGAKVVFNNTNFSNTVVNYGEVTFNNCTFVTNEIEDHAQASYTGTTVEPKNTVVKEDLSDIYEIGSVYRWDTFEEALNDYTSQSKVRLNTDLNEAGNAKVSSKIKELTGWLKNDTEYREEERQIDSAEVGKITFVKDSDILVKNFHFSQISKSHEGTDILIEAGAKVHFKDVRFAKTVVNYGDATFENCTFTTSKIENHGQADYTGTTVEPENTVKEEIVEANDNEYWINDSSYDLEKYLANRNNAGIIKLNANLTSVGNVVFDSSYKALYGWDKSFFGDNGESLRQIGFHTAGTIKFKKNSKMLVSSINFNKRNHADAVGALITIDKGAKVHFKNVTFHNTIVNNGQAVFEDCTFKTNEIENNGSATYTGSTKQPTNTGSASTEHVDLGLKIKTTLKDVVKNETFTQNVEFEVYGTNASKANVEISTEDNNGLVTNVENNVVTISGQATKAMQMKYTIKVSALDESVEKTFTLNVLEPIKVFINKSFPSTMTTLKTKTTVDGLSRATGGGSSGGGSALDYSASSAVYIQEGENEKVNYNEFKKNNPNVKLESSISPSGSGLSTSYMYDSLSVYGRAETKGTYYVQAKVSDGVRSATSNQASLKIMADDTSFQDILNDLDSNTKEWDIEPYTISKVNKTIIPKHLNTLYGSHTSGTYAILGNNKTYATETITIPSGANVKFVNVKIYSSVKVVVEKGATLTMDDSGIYGLSEVNGGTIIIRDCHIMDTLTLNNGSTLKDSKIKSKRLLSDGSTQKDDATNAVLVNGNVKVVGHNTINAAGGDGSKTGQTALYVNGVVDITNNSSLKAQGGIGEIYSVKRGGDGVYLNKGRIQGQGHLEALGGSNYESNGGMGINGQGVINTKTLKAVGGDSKSIFNDVKKGGNAIGEKVIVLTKDYELAGGKGNPDGTSVITLDKEDVKDPSKPVTPNKPNQTLPAQNNKCKDVKKNATTYKYKLVNKKCFNYQSVTKTTKTHITKNYQLVNNKKVLRSKTTFTYKNKKVVKKAYLTYNKYSKLTSSKTYVLKKNKFNKTYQRTVTYYANKKVKTNKVVYPNKKTTYYKYNNKGKKQTYVKLTYKKNRKASRVEYKYNKQGKLKSTKTSKAYYYKTSYTKKGKAKKTTRQTYNAKGKKSKARKVNLRA